MRNEELEETRGRNSDGTGSLSCSLVEISPRRFVWFGAASELSPTGAERPGVGGSASAQALGSKRQRGGLQPAQKLRGSSPKPSTSRGTEDAASSGWVSWVGGDLRLILRVVLLGAGH